MDKKTLIIGIVFMILAIMLGAFGAHGLKEIVDSDQIDTFETGVRYQFFQSLGLMILAFNSDKLGFNLRWVRICLVTGVVLFSGSIYFLVLQHPMTVSLKFLGPFTPVGGLLMILGWTLLLIKLLSRRSGQQ